ncbi:Tubulin polyglutamylase ttll6 [Blastocladiella emersonii ATCC 22665]|nr:Tubulin polyglutamylase ttll6 [Blastocladiella emersonii ATCC 22665]
MLSSRHEQRQSVASGAKPPPPATWRPPRFDDEDEPGDAPSPIINRSASVDVEAKRPSANVARGSGRATRKAKFTPTLNVDNTKHAVVQRAGLGAGLQLTSDEASSTVVWMDGVVSVARLLALEPWQRINHFPGMHHVCHKDYLARNLARMRAQFPKEYAFWPRTWCMRTEHRDFVAHAQRRPGKWFIAKPDSKSRGIGIYLLSDPNDYEPDGEFDMVVQQYIERPMLIDGYKFDLRVYALITHCDPLRVYVYKEGLARFATEPYGTGPDATNRHRVCMHLTNFSINKKSSKFVDGGATGGSKRTLTWALQHLDSLGHDGSGAVWASIKDIIAKSLLPIQPELARIFRSCFPNAAGSPSFELLGFDILLDHKLRPYVLEINHSPSLSCETAVDHAIKQTMLENVFTMLNLTSLNPIHWTRTRRREAKRRLYAAATSTPNLSSSTSPPPASPIGSRSAGRPVSAPTPTTTAAAAMPAVEAESDDWESQHRGQFEPVLPTTDPARAKTYADLRAAAAAMFEVPDTAASRARRSQVAKFAVATASVTVAAAAASAAPLPPLPNSAGRGPSATPPPPVDPKARAAAVRALAERQIASYVARKRERAVGNRTTVAVAVRTLGEAGGGGHGRSDEDLAWNGTVVPRVSSSSTGAGSAGSLGRGFPVPVWSTASSFHVLGSGGGMRG